MKYDDNTLLTGNYEGVYVYKINDSKISFSKKIPELIGTFKQLEKYKNTVYAQLPNVGVLEFELD